VNRRLLLVPAGLLVLAACSGEGQQAASSNPAPAQSPSAAPSSSSAAPAPAPTESTASPSGASETILAVLCDSATKEQKAVIEAAMKPGFTVKQLVDVRTREGGEHAILGIVEGPGVSGMARWIGSKLLLEGLLAADQAAMDSSTAAPMTDPSQDAIDYLNQTMSCFDLIHED